MFRIEFPQVEPQNLAVKLTPTAESIMLRSEHPWVFSESIQKINKEGKAGDVAILFRQKNNQVFGVGLFDPSSPIKIKMVHYFSGAKINREFFSLKIQESYLLRKPLWNKNTNSYRLLFGENDGFPGFIADVYADVLVVKLYSAIWYPYLKDILEELLKVSKCETIVLRLSRNLQESNEFEFKDGQILYGELENEVVEFIEHGIHFSANVIKGHKTGYFLDHRANRKRVGELAKDKSVLDVFSYAGGFSVHALAGGAKETTSLDVSKQALEMAKENVALNSFKGRHLTLLGDAFAVLNELISKGKTYDLVVIDPPSFAKSQKEEVRAKSKYNQLAKLGIQLTAPEGVLVLASCSSRISSDDFFEINETALKNSTRKFKTLRETYHDIDHPITFKEGAYLKCGYYKFAN